MHHLLDEEDESTVMAMMLTNIVVEYQLNHHQGNRSFPYSSALYPSANPSC